MQVVYALEPDLPAEAFRGILVASTLGERRPINGIQRLECMLRNADLIVTARLGDRLVGMARAITDFAYCCYLSDLAVDVRWQGQGIGRELMRRTREAAGGEKITMLLLSAPAVMGYYPKAGLTKYENCFGVPRGAAY